MQKKVKFKDINLILNIKNVLKNILFYSLYFIISLIFYKKTPIGAIALFTYAYSAGFILTPSILISLAAILISGNAPYLLVYIFYIPIFISLTILLKPLVAVHEIYEKLKVEKYLLFVCFYLNLFIFGFWESIYISLLCFVIYKFIVNVLPMIKNKDKKRVFSNTEIVSYYMFIILTVLVSMLLINKYFGLDIYICFVITYFISAICLLKNMYNVDLKSTFILIILTTLINIIAFKVYFNNLVLVLNLAFIWLSLKLNKKESIIYNSIFIVSTSIIFILLKDYFDLALTISLNLISIIYVLGKENLKIFNIFNFNKYISSFGEHNFSYTSDPMFIYRKVYDKDKKTTFETLLINSENLENNDLFNEIKHIDDIKKWIFYSINNFNSLEISKFYNILEINNILIPKNEIFNTYIKEIEDESINIFNAISNSENINILNKD